jgi:hypothetical protein
MKNMKSLELMGHLALNSELGGVYGVNYSVKQISDNNPPRGYFILTDSTVLNSLRERYGLPATEELERIMGFIYGWIMYDTEIVPIDIEITLGLYDDDDDKILFNVLDFGMTFDLRNPYEAKKLPRTAPIFDILEQKSLTDSERNEMLLERSMNDISIDLYSDVVDNVHAAAGFRMASEFAVANRQ